MSKQSEMWEKEFGRAYTARNEVDWRTRLPAFRTMIDGLGIRSALEIGCNRGHNLLALHDILGDAADIVGIEVNPYAVEMARASSPHVAVLRGRANELPFKDGSIDLVFTAGVLIHIPPPEFEPVLREIVRVSRRWILAVEYFAEKDEAIVYRGEGDLLWKRNFLRHYQSVHPALKLVRSGYWDLEQGFDRCHWWLLEKPGRA